MASDTSTVIETFMAAYSDGGYLAYEKLTEQAGLIVASELDEADIEHELSDRRKSSSARVRVGSAKSPASTRNSILRRQIDRKAAYQATDEIFSDLPDLAGIRIALYYPNDFQRVQDMINRRFVEVKAPQDWPDPAKGPFRYPKLDEGDSKQRLSQFPGYLARHYRVRLKEEDVSEPAVQGKTFEIQLMSVLMHAWAKMHYELIYKPKPGFPSADDSDERLLDASNGIIIASEQILRQIQINQDRKKELGKEPFKNEHDACSYLAENWTSIKDSLSALPGPRLPWLNDRDFPVGGARMHLLYESLRRLGLNSPHGLGMLVEDGLKSGYQGSGKESGLVDMLITSLVLHDNFKAVELTQPGPSTNETRYKATILCNTLRGYGSSSGSLRPVWDRDTDGSFPGPYPSGQEFLKMVHPLNPPENDLRVLANLRSFCDFLLVWEDPLWKLNCAVSKLEYLTADGKAPAKCPWALIRLLDFCVRKESSRTTLASAFTQLENAKKCNNKTVLDSPHHRHVPAKHRVYWSADVLLEARPELTSAGLGVWKLDVVGV